ncbi:UBC-like protein [Ustulina deusta]|nr:UBC-like protein [Ustulina deusta]
MPPSAIQRMRCERRQLEVENPDYKVFFRGDNLLELSAFVIGPNLSVYRNKLLAFDFVIPEAYPTVPPQVTFVQCGSERIHPKFHPDGTVDLSILRIRPHGEWLPDLSIFTILTVIRAELDHDPDRRDAYRELRCPAYNQFVQYMTWRSLLLDYFGVKGPEDVSAFLWGFARARGSSIIDELLAEEEANRNVTSFSTPYRPGITFTPDYNRLI